MSLCHAGCDDDKKLKVDFKSISCKVCNAPSSGFHFGAITCEGCKVCLMTFFFPVSLMQEFNKSVAGMADHS